MLVGSLNTKNTTEIHVRSLKEFLRSHHHVSPHYVPALAEICFHDLLAITTWHNIFAHTDSLSTDEAAHDNSQLPVVIGNSFFGREGLFLLPRIFTVPSFNIEMESSLCSQSSHRKHKETLSVLLPSAVGTLV